jgi:hypothetical protein
VRLNLPALCKAWLGPLLVLALLWAAPVARAIELARLDVERSEQGVGLSFETRFELPHGVQDALEKGVALHFVADATLMRSRWYWRDQKVAQASRSWRLSYQPLTLTYRVSQGGLSRQFGSLAEALGTVQRASRWRIGEGLAADDSGNYYVEFSYRLDLGQLARPLLIGIGSQPEWDLRVERSMVLGPDRTTAARD